MMNLLFLGVDLQFGASRFICPCPRSGLPALCLSVLEVVAGASTLETGMGTDRVTLGCPICSHGHPLVGPGEHPVPHCRPPSYCLDHCDTVRTGLVYLSEAEHQVSLRQPCSQDLCNLLSSVPFLILLSVILMPHTK